MKLNIIYLGGTTAILKNDFPILDNTSDLKAIFEKNKISVKSAYILIPRHKVIIKTFELPSGDKEEIDKMVRFQLEKELPIPLESVIYTYKTQTSKDKVRSQCIVVQKEIVQGYNDQLKSNSIKPNGFFLTTHALAEILPKEGIQTLVCKMDDCVELLITNDGALSFTHSIDVHDKNSSEIADEINRAVTSYKAQGGQVNGVKLLSDSEDVKTCIEKLLPQVEEIKDNPFNVCLASACKNLEKLPDIAKPIKIKREIKLAPASKLIIACCFFIALVIAGLNIWAISTEDKVKQFKKDYAGILSAVQSLEKLHKVNADCSRWQNKQVDWFLSLVELTLKLDTKIVYVTSLSYNEEANAVTLGARAKSQDDIMKVLNAFKGTELMVLDEKYQPSVQYVEKDPFGFKYQFSVNLKVK